MATDMSAATKPAAPRLNVPAAMAGSLRLDATSPARSSSRLFDLPKTPSPSKVVYSDRFIPCRSSSRLQNFALLDGPSPNSKNSPAAPDTPYTRLLRAELFPDSSPGAAGNPTSPNTNLFRYKTDHSAPSSPFASADRQDFGVGSGASTPKKAPRKVPKTPHKVGALFSLALVRISANISRVRG
jgi:cell division cycle 20-like protein 1 (cofactor of APC complex)